MPDTPPALVTRIKALIEAEDVTLHESVYEAVAALSAPRADAPADLVAPTHEWCPQCGDIARLGGINALRKDNGERWCRRCYVRLAGGWTVAWQPPAASGPPVLFGSWPKDYPGRAFVDGAAWWEWAKTGGTMWATDRDRAEAEAERRFGPPAAPPAPKWAPTGRCTHCEHTALPCHGYHGGRMLMPPVVAPAAPPQDAETAALVQALVDVPTGETP